MDNTIYTKIIIYKNIGKRYKGSNAFLSFSFSSLKILFEIYFCITLLDATIQHHKDKTKSIRDHSSKISLVGSVHCFTI